MDFELTDEQKMFRDAVRDFAQKEIAPLVDAAEEGEKFPVEIIGKLGKLGYLGPSFDPKYGGAGLGKIGECILVEELGRVCAGIAGAIMVHSGIGLSLIRDYGNADQIERFLLPAIRGEKISAIAITEPNAGSDVSGVETKAVRQGNHYLVNGNKIFISNAPYADFFLTVAYTDKTKGVRQGMSVIVIEKGTPGLSVKKLRMLGQRSCETGELVFEDCRVPASNVIGEEGSGFVHVMESLGEARLPQAFLSLGIAQACYEESLSFAKGRSQFGRPVGKFQAIGFKIARMAMEIEVARWMCYRAVWLLDQGKDCIKEGSYAKLMASEVAQRVTAEGMQIHGGYGYSMESKVQRFFRDARLLTIGEGTSEIQQLIISKQLGL